MNAIREYHTTAASIKVFGRSMIKFFPKWCPAISSNWTRAQAAEALRGARKQRVQIGIKRGRAAA